MTWLQDRLAELQALVARPLILALILVVDVAAYFGGLLYWYGDVMTDPATPLWAWPFIPDCPLFGLLGGLGLLMVTAERTWSAAARLRAQRVLLALGVLSALLWLSTYLAALPLAWQQQSALLAVWSWSLLITALFFFRMPSWLLGLFAFGQIKYGLWTITAWLLFWNSTARAFGSPLFTFDSVFMTITHVGLLLQGILLLTYIRFDLATAAASFVWFLLSDFVDYGLGFYPAIPEQYIPLRVMQWSTIAVTFLLSGVYLWLARRQTALRRRWSINAGADAASDRPLRVSADSR